MARQGKQPRQMFTDDPTTFSQKIKARWSYPARRSSREYAELFHTNPGLDSLDLIASTIASCNYQVFNRNQYLVDKERAKPIPNHLVLAILENPMPEYQELDGYALLYITAAFKKLLGEFFWLIERDSRGFPCALYPIPPSWVVNTWNVSRPFFQVLPMGNTSYQMINVDKQDIIWFKELDINNPYNRGRGRVEAIGDELEGYEMLAKYQKNLFYNDAQPPMVVSVVDGSDEEVRQLKEGWLSRVAGWINARAPSFVNRKLDIQKLTDSPRELDMTESGKYLRDLLNQHFSMPPEMRGILDNSNRSTIDSAYYLFAKNNIAPELERIAAQLNRQLMPNFDTTSILVFDNVVDEDESFKLEVMSKGLQLGTVTVDEWRLAMGHKELPNGAGQVRLLPINVVMVPVNETGEPDVLTLEPPASQESTGEVTAGDSETSTNKPVEEVVPQADMPAEPQPKPAKMLIDAMAKQLLSSEQKAAHWKALDASATANEPVFTQVLNRHAKDERNRFLTSFKNSVKSGNSQAVAMEEALHTVVDQGGDRLYKALTPAWMHSYQTGAKHALDILQQKKGYKKDIAPQFDLFNPMFLAKIKAKGLDKAKGIQGTTKTALRDTLQAGIEAGESMEKLGARVSDAYSALETVQNMPGWRALMIAKTETMSSINAAQVMVYRSEGVQQKEWLSTMDDFVRDSHAAMNGTIVGISEDFDVNGDMMDAPGDGSDPAEVVNCRCTSIPVIGDKYE